MRRPLDAIPTKFVDEMFAPLEYVERVQLKSGYGWEGSRVRSGRRV